MCPRPDSGVSSDSPAAPAPRLFPPRFRHSRPPSPIICESPDRQIGTRPRSRLPPLPTFHHSGATSCYTLTRRSHRRVPALWSLPGHMSYTGAPKRPHSDRLGVGSWPPPPQVVSVRPLFPSTGESPGQTDTRPDPRPLTEGCATRFRWSGDKVVVAEATDTPRVRKHQHGSRAAPGTHHIPGLHSRRGFKSPLLTVRNRAERSD